MDDFGGQAFDHFKSEDIQDELNEILRNVYKYEDVNTRLKTRINSVSKKFESIDKIT